MPIKKFRWSRVYESPEEELLDVLDARNLDSVRIHTEMDDEQTEQHAQDATTIWCAEGSCIIKINSTSMSLQPGDALDLDANTTYSIHPGIANCVYYLTH